MVASIPVIEIVVVVGGVVVVLGLCWFGICISVDRDLKREDRRASEEKTRAAEEKRRQKAEGIRSFPVRRLTQEEFSRITTADQLPDRYLETCPIGLWFVCRPNNDVPEVTVIGQVVEGNDLICDQWGSGLALPARGINRYRVEIVEARPVTSST
ncbi:hypothetical protein IH781_01570 [Patescibacteria group bacterium]|nr:hypothetical protein [Patescibacteria group bacterium]